MNHAPESTTNAILSAVFLTSALALALVLACPAAAATGQNEAKASGASSPIHVTHVLGFEDEQRNVGGELSIINENLRFHRRGSPPAQVSLASIQTISVGAEDKQVGGVPMMLGKAAVPFGGGRVVSLFSHKKYDTIAIEYLDGRGGLHGAIFRLAKGQGETFKHALIEHGASIARQANAPAVQSTPEESFQVQKWSVQVDRVDPGDTTVDPCFSNAIYENLLRELSKSTQFAHVFRSGDRNANASSGVLVLRTLVDKYFAGSETRRAVTTVGGATKLRVRIQLVTRDGKVVLERAVEGNVRFIGDNLGVTNKVANKTAKILNRSTLPAPATLMPQQPMVKEAAAIS